MNQAAKKKHPMVHEFNTRRAIAKRVKEFNDDLKSQMGAKEAKALTLKGTHRNTVNWIFRVFEILNNRKEGVGLEPVKRVIKVDGVELHCPVFKTNGAFITACLGHEKPRRFDEHAERCEMANIFWRTSDFKENKIRSYNIKQEYIAINPTLIKYK